MISRNEVIDAYILILGREVESEDVIQQKIIDMKSVSMMVQVMLNSSEFKSPVCVKRLESKAVTEKVVIQGYRLILGKEPESQDVIDTAVTNMKSQRHFVLALARSKEYRQNNNFKKFIASDSFNSKAKVIYLHIPKTAGKAIEKLAEKNYVNNCSLSTSGKFSWGAWKECTMVGGHFFYSRYDGMTGRRLFLSVIRDPVDRAISRFNFYKNDSAGIRYRKLRGFVHDDLLKTIKRSTFRGEFINNYQCRYLSGRRKFSAVQKAFQKDAFIVGHYEEIDKWLALMGERLGWSDLSLPKVNVATDPSYMNQYKEDNVLMDLLCKRNREDYRLFDFVKQHGVYESFGSDFDYAPFRVRSS
jgi:hypothetical protein